MHELIHRVKLCTPCNMQLNAPNCLCGKSVSLSGWSIENFWFISHCTIRSRWAWGETPRLLLDFDYVVQLIGLESFNVILCSVALDHMLQHNFTLSFLHSHSPNLHGISKLRRSIFDVYNLFWVSAAEIVKCNTLWALDDHETQSVAIESGQ